MRFALVPVAFLCCAVPLTAQDGGQSIAESAWPDAPSPQTPSSSPLAKPNPCIPRDQPAASNAGPPTPGQLHPAVVPCTTKRLNFYQRFMNGPKDKPLTARDKGWLALRNVADPFNLITIGGEAGISVAADSHSPYGPGMPGYARYVGVSFTEDLTGEFFGTFLIPSLVHQDPHYHRSEHQSIPKRIGRSLLQVVWAQNDLGGGMPNYANLVGFAIDDEIANLYVPGRKTDFHASAQRYAIGLATAPIGNLISEFLPDVASHIHVQVVILQRIINQVARSGATTAGGTPTGFSETSY